MDLVIKTVHCKAKHTMNLKPDLRNQDVAGLILLSNLPKPWPLVCALENRPLSLKYFTHRVIHRVEFCECSFSAGPYYVAQTVLSFVMLEQHNSKRWII